MAGLNFIVLTGRFAAGKDTQAAILEERLGSSSYIISTGDIYIGAKSGVGEYAHFYSFVTPYIDDIDIKGLLLPDRVMTQMVQEVITEKVNKGKETFIFTGFPRTVGQLEYFDEMITNFSDKFEVKSVFIEYKISDETSFERSLKRRVEMEGRGETPRPWDCNEGIAKRTLTYHNEIEPMIKNLKREGRLIEIDANKTIPEVETETSLKIFSKERM